MFDYEQSDRIKKKKKKKKARKKKEVRKKKRGRKKEILAFLASFADVSVI